MTDPNQRIIQAFVEANLSVEGADDFSRSINQARRESDSLSRSVNDTEKNLGRMTDAFKSVANAASLFTVAAVSVRKVFDTLGMNDLQKELADYSKGLLASRVQFSKYNEGIIKTEARINSLKKEFAFTRSELLSLQSAFEKGFAFQRPERMVGVFKTLRSAVGENVEEMMRLQGSIAAISKSAPIMEELFVRKIANGTGEAAKNATKIYEALLASGAASGRIDSATFKEQLGILDSIRTGQGMLTSAERKRTEELNDNVRVLNEMKVLWEDIRISIAENLQPFLSNINKMIQNGGEGLKDTLATLATIGKVMAGIGSVAASLAALQFIGGMGGMGGMGGGTRGRGGAGGIGGLSDFAMYGALRVYVVNWGGQLTQSPTFLAGGGRRGGPKGSGGRGAGRAAARTGLFARMNAPMRMPAPVASAGARVIGAGGMALRGAAFLSSASLIAGIPASMATSAYNNSFASGEHLSKGSKMEARARMAGSIATGAITGAIVGSVVPVVGTAIGAGVGALSAALINLSTKLDDTSEHFHKTNSALSQSLHRQYELAGSDEEKELISLKLQMNALNDREQEELSKNSTLGSFFGFGANKKELEEIRKERERLNGLTQRQSRLVEDVNNKQKQQTSEVSTTAQALAKVNANLRIADSFVKFQNEKLQQQVNLYDSIIATASRFGGQTFGLDVEANFDQAMKEYNELFKLQDIAKNLMLTTREQILANIQEAGDEYSPDISPIIEDLINLARESNVDLGEEFTEKIMETSPALALKEIETQYAKILTEQNNARIAQNQLLEKDIQRYEGLQSLAEAATGKVEADMDLATNLAAGIAPSASMRMELVNQIQSQVDIANYQLESLKGRLADFQELANNASTEEERNRILDQTLSLKTKIIETETKITNLNAKQAETTKVIRDGYISAIAAMNTGAGMFTQITIDQNRNLGQLQSATNNKLVSLRSGAEARGLLTSERYTAGGIMSDGNRFGASDEVNELIKSSNPLAAFFDVKDDMKDGIVSTGAKIVKAWQENAGRFFSTLSASLLSQPYGTSELQDFITSTTGNVTSLGNGVVIEGISDAESSDIMDNIKLSTNIKDIMSNSYKNNSLSSIAKPYSAENIFNNDYSLTAKKPEPILNSIDKEVNSYLNSPESTVKDSSHKVEIILNSKDKKRIADSLVSDMTDMMLNVLQRTEQRIMDDLLSGGR